MTTRVLPCFLFLGLVFSFSGLAAAKTDCPEAIASAARLKSFKKVVGKEHLSLKQRIIFSLRPHKLNALIQEEFHRRGLDPATCSEPDMKEAILAGYRRAWDSVTTSGKRFLNGAGLTAVGAVLFYFANKGLQLILGETQAQAGAFFLGVVGAPLVASLSASVMEVIGSSLRNRSFKMKEFVSEVTNSAKPRLQDLYFIANASMASTQQAGRQIQTDADTNFTDKIRWATENLLAYLESNQELRMTKAAEVVALALIKLRENYPDIMQAILADRDQTILREPRRLLGGLFRDTELKVDAFYNDVLRIVRQEDPLAANNEIAEAFEAVLTRLLEPPKGQLPKEPSTDELKEAS
ncbi:MAG: hypothetical protein H6617_04790 [Bdellovibrionaceae bacterium]|nr:hypothetical protein [Pseudobdellovibrionaceae bacterium]